MGSSIVGLTIVSKHFNKTISKQIKLFHLTKCCPLLKRKSHNESKYIFITSDLGIQSYLNEKEKSFNDNNERMGYKIILANLFGKRKIIKSNLISLNEFKSDSTSDAEFKELVLDERNTYTNQLLNVEFQLLQYLMPKLTVDAESLIFEITAGVGGKEAMLFAGSLYDMYLGYFNYKGWDYLNTEVNSSELGGIRNVSLIVEGKEAYRHLQYESGVHRVQRIPVTEKNSRIHTSTASIAVLPHPTEVEVNLEDKDLIIETKRANGAGGQHVNTTDSAVRITHVPSGIITECQTERSQIKNKRIALFKLRTKIYQFQLEKQEEEIRKLRKSQVGNSSRSDKVRTYNFPQDRITDHRLKKNSYNINDFLKGGEPLDNMVHNLYEMVEQEDFESFIAEIRNQIV